MVPFLLFAALSLLSGVLALAGDLVRSLMTNGSSLSPRQGGGYYYSFWSEGGGNWRCSNGAGGQYSATWSGSSGGFVCGKGWQGGGARSVPSPQVMSYYLPHGLVK